MNQTPKSDVALARFPEFVERIQARLESGKRVYGDSSFERPLESLVEEIRQEALDVAGWAFILFERLAELERSVFGLDRAEADAASVPRTAAPDSASVDRASPDPAAAAHVSSGEVAEWLRSQNE